MGFLLGFRFCFIILLLFCVNTILVLISFDNWESRFSNLVLFKNGLAILNLLYLYLYCWNFRDSLKKKRVSLLFS